MRFRDCPMSGKLMILMMAASSAALLLACAVLLGYDFIASRRVTAEHLSTLAQIITDNSKAALSFGDPAAAGEVLATLRAEPHITAACIYDKQGKAFALYHAQDARDSNTPALRPPGTYFDSDRLVQCRQVVVEGEEIGSVYLESDMAEVTERLKRYAGILAAVMIVSWLAALLVASRLHPTITEPMTRLIQVARDIGESGDLDQNISFDRNDEIGELGRTFGKMVVYLKEMAMVSEAIARGDLTVEVEPRSRHDTLGKAFGDMLDGLRSSVRSVRDAAAQVAGGSNQVADTSEQSAKAGVRASSAIDEVTSTMQEMSINVQRMVKNTQMQASSVGETSASINQMIASIQRVADNAKLLLEISKRSHEEVQAGTGTMQKATDGLSRINHAIGSSAKIIAALGERADDIGKITEVIDDIAEQVNLLALNAAIEAARAGEHGLGFAVVADEVRKLAEKSAHSTKEISELIRRIQKEARNAVENMEQSTNIVNEGLTLGNDLSLALNKISDVVNEVYKFAQAIGAATNEQLEGTSQIAKTTSRLNEITHETTAVQEEQASGVAAVVKAMEGMREMVKTQTAASTELAASSDQMSKMAHLMMESMHRFTVDDDPSLEKHADSDPQASSCSAAS